MRWTTALALALLLVGHARAQQRNAHWPLPPGSWLHFDGNGTQVDPGIPATEWDYQSASISSPTGQLQLYNGRFGVYNANGDTVIVADPYSDAIAPGQGWLYCPWPGDSDRIAGFAIRLNTSLIYYQTELRSCIFQRDLVTGHWQLEAGSEQMLIDSTTWKLTAVAHANGADYWILAHRHSSDAFLAYRLSASGVDPVPVISHTGTPLPIETDPLVNLARSGTLVASYDGTQLALSSSGSGLPPPYYLFSELYHFDASTGVVAAYATLPAYPNTLYFGTEFSPDGTKLYQLHGVRDAPNLFTSTLRQFDLSSQDPVQIAASAEVIRSDGGLIREYGATSTVQMATAPDGRIYVLWSQESSLAVINEPNAPGAACNFVVDQIQLPDTVANTLPNQIKRYHDSEFSVGVQQAHVGSAELEVWPVPTDGLVQVRSRNAGVVLVVDALGRTVLTQPISQNTIMQVDLSRSSPGAYAVHLLTPGSAPVYRMITKR